MLLLLPFPAVLHLQVLSGLTTVWSFILTWSSTRSRNWTSSLKQATALTSKNAKCLLGLIWCFWLYSGKFLLPCGPSGFRVIWGFRLLRLAELQCVTFEACVCCGGFRSVCRVFNSSADVAGLRGSWGSLFIFKCTCSNSLKRPSNNTWLCSWSESLHGDEIMNWFLWWPNVFYLRRRKNGILKYEGSFMMIKLVLKLPGIWFMFFLRPSILLLSQVITSQLDNHCQ